ncbi:hypothetical protein [Bosea sp. 117]|uniref:hypothetical protein n=1 Tax=Bosea sp. 117 TaxID=1125973 RepID=UPI000494008D|nr:hypothetical protein [Bosea sp. 117]
MLDHDPLLEPESPSRGAMVVAVIALVFVVLLAGLTGYLALQVIALNETVTRLSMAQVDLKDAIAALDAQAPGGSPDAAPAAAAPAPAPAASVPAQPAANGALVAAAPPAGAGDAFMPPMPGASANTGSGAGAPGTPSAAADAPAEAKPALAGSGFTVRVFAPSGSFDKNQLAKLVQNIRSLGFEADVSDDGLAQPEISSVTYHPAVKDVAEKLMGMIRSKYAAKNFESRPSDSIPPSVQKVIFMNLAAGALS